MQAIGKLDIPHRCPFCLEEKGCFTAMDETGEGVNAIPENGDVSFCWQCGEFAIFDSAAEGEMRKPSDDEAIEIGLDPMLRNARSGWLQLNKIMPRDASLKEEP